MKIYPINQTPVTFKGLNNNQTSVMKRYCEPRTGVYYYYDSVQFEKEKSQNSISGFLKGLVDRFSNMSKGLKNAFTQEQIKNTDSEEILWL